MVDDTPKGYVSFTSPETPEVKGRAQDSPWLSFEDIRQRLKVSEKLLRRELVEGRIPASRIGRLWRIHRDDLDQAIRERAS